MIVDIVMLLLLSCSIFISFSTWRTGSEGGDEVYQESESSQNVLGKFIFEMLFFAAGILFQFLFELFCIWTMTEQWAHNVVHDFLDWFIFDSILL